MENGAIGAYSKIDIANSAASNLKILASYGLPDVSTHELGGLSTADIGDYRIFRREDGGVYFQVRKSRSLNHAVIGRVNLDELKSSIGKSEEEQFLEALNVVGKKYYGARTRK